MKDYRDKVAVITGAGRGIGRGIALRCAKEGMKVVLAGFGDGIPHQDRRRRAGAGGRDADRPDGCIPGRTGGESGSSHDRSLWPGRPAGEQRRGRAAGQDTGDHTGRLELGNGGQFLRSAPWPACIRPPHDQTEAAQSRGQCLIPFRRAPGGRVVWGLETCRAGPDRVAVSGIWPSRRPTSRFRCSARVGWRPSFTAWINLVRSVSKGR